MNQYQIPQGFCLHILCSTLLRRQWKDQSPFREEKTGCGSLSPLTVVVGRARKRFEWKILYNFPMFNGKYFYNGATIPSRFDSIAMVLIESFVRTSFIIVLPSVVVSGSFLCTKPFKDTKCFWWISWGNFPAKCRVSLVHNGKVNRRK